MISNTTPRSGDAVMPVPTQGGLRGIGEVRRKQGVKPVAGAKPPLSVDDPLFFSINSICVFQTNALAVCGNIYGGSIGHRIDRQTGNIEIDTPPFAEASEARPTPEGDVVVGHRISQSEQYFEIFY
ncbi:MAG: hypothetical protein HC935_10370 [Pseudanabaena sp. SU_2_4]|nr:hypothetical protein [Pseudanabaena sp. SU_2_4]